MIVKIKIADSALLIGADKQKGEILVHVPDHTNLVAWLTSAKGEVPEDFAVNPVMAGAWLAATERGFRIDK